MAIPALALPLIMQGIQTGGQLLASGIQSDKSKKIKPKRPEMKMPSAISEKTNIAKSMADSSLLPAQGYYENQIGAQTARSVRDIKKAGGSSNEVISALSNLDNSARTQVNNLVAMGAENQARNKAMYGNALSEKAQYQQEMFDYNENQPYQTALLRQQALQDASNRNFSNAMQSASSIVSNLGMGSIMDNMYGTNYYTFPKKTRSSYNMNKLSPDYEGYNVRLG